MIIQFCSCTERVSSFSSNLYVLACNILNKDFQKRYQCPDGFVVTNEFIDIDYEQ